MAKQIKRTFDSLADAMSTLPGRTLSHCTRVGKYLEILFLQALNDEIYVTDPKAVARMKEDYKEIVSQIGLYHDIGKAMLPEEYQFCDDAFGEEETALYRKHVDYSVELAEKLWFTDKEQNLNAFQRSMITETFSCHHERWDGAGFPEGLSGKEIPLFARMVYLVDRLDNLSCTIHSEHPFEDALERIKEGADGEFDPVLVDELKIAAPKMNLIFKAEAKDTNMIPPVTAFVGKGKKTFSLWYRPIVDRTTGKTGAVEAKLRFHFNKEWKDYDEVEPLLKTDKHMKRDLSVCAVLEACDAIRRFDACGFDFKYLALHLPGTWLNQPGSVAELLKCLQDADVAPKKLCAVLTAADFTANRATLKENVAKLRAAGCGVMFSDLTLNADAAPDKAKPISGTVTEREVIEMAPSVYRVGPDDLTKDLVDNYFPAIRNIAASGVTLIAGNIEQTKFASLLNYFEINYMTGALCGDPVTADDFIKAELAAQES